MKSQSLHWIKDLDSGEVPPGLAVESDVTETDISLVVALKLSVNDTVEMAAGKDEKEFNWI